MSNKHKETDAVYRSDVGEETNRAMSEKVQTMASGIYNEFQHMIKVYDDDVVKRLMPLVVGVLEVLNQSYLEKQEIDVEVELLKTDNEQLLTQYEREKNMRRDTEQKYLETEDIIEENKKLFDVKFEKLENSVKTFELKARNAQDHVARFEEREFEMKSEYTKLHDRYTDLFKKHADVIERAKGNAMNIDTESYNNKIKINLRHDDSHSGDFNAAGGDCTSEYRSRSSTRDSYNDSDLDMDKKLFSESESLHQEAVRVSPADSYTSDDYVWPVTSKPTPPPSKLYRLNFSDTDTDSSSADDSPHRRGRQVTTPTTHDDSAPEDNDDDAMSISRSTVDTLTDCVPASDNKPVDNNNHDASSLDQDIKNHKKASVHDEMLDSSKGIGKEVEDLIQENKELLATKNALNIVKDDLIERVDTITSEHELLIERTKVLIASKEKMTLRLHLAEDELKKMRHLKDLHDSEQDKKQDDADVPAAQRKRFTRMEMARVLMERNKYKERLFELQEAVRWAETVRAARDHPDELREKKKSGGVWGFFSHLFSPNSPPPQKLSRSSSASPSKSVSPSLKYTHQEPVKGLSTSASSSPVTPVGDPNRYNRESLGLGKEKAYDFLKDDHSQRTADSRNRKEGGTECYKKVHAHVDKDDGRMQAYGWSIPLNTSEGGASKHQNVPIPIHNKHLFPDRDCRQLWCASGVNTAGGRTKDGGNVVGASVFYTNSDSDATTTKAANQDDIEKLSSEIEKHVKINESCDVEESSIVWVCSTIPKSSNNDDTNSRVTIFDAIVPSVVIQEFSPSKSPIVCMATVPGTNLNDYEDNDLSEVNCSPTSTAADDPCSPNSSDVEVKKVATTVTLGAIAMVTCSTSNNKRITTPIKKSPPPNTESSVIVEKVEHDTTSSKDSEDNKEKDSDAIDCLQADQLQEFSLMGPTMWLGSQSGSIYVYSTNSSLTRCLDSIKLKDSISCILHVKGRVFVGLANGTIAVFHRNNDGSWNTDTYHLLSLDSGMVKCSCYVEVTSSIWFTINNVVFVVNPKTLTIKETFKAHPRKESQIRQVKAFKDGVWFSMHLDSTIRLFNAHAPYHHLQDLDVEPIVAKILGNGKLGFIFVRIISLMIDGENLWIGTSNGVIISLPIAKAKLKDSLSTVRPGGCTRVYNSDDPDNPERLRPALATPTVQQDHALISFHGHKDAVNFLVSVKGKDRKSERLGGKDTLVLSGGDCYTDHRIEAEDEDNSAVTASEGDLTRTRHVRENHLIIWEVL